MFILAWWMEPQSHMVVAVLASSGPAPHMRKEARNEKGREKVTIACITHACLINTWIKVCVLCNSTVLTTVLNNNYLIESGFKWL